MAGEDAPTSVFPTLVGRPRHVVGSLTLFDFSLSFSHPSLALTHSYAYIHMHTYTHKLGCDGGYGTKRCLCW